MGGPHRAGQSIRDECRVCKQERTHTVVAVDGDGAILQVSCDYCGSRHRFRGGGGAASVRSAAAPPPAAEGAPRSGAPGDAPLEALLRRVLREETGVTPVDPAPKWRGGHVVLKPGKPGLAEKTLPIDTLLAKIVAVRNRLRVLEQKINTCEELPDDVKVKLQGYITGCYGSLTSFNVLFAHDEDRFKGTGG